MAWVVLRIRVSELVGMARVRIRAHKDRSRGTWRERARERKCGPGECCKDKIKGIWRMGERG